MAIILDIRTPQEYAQGHLPDSILIPTRSPPEADFSLTRRYLQMVMAGKPPATTTLVYCRLGKRSAVAARILGDLGFRDVRDLGGIEKGPLREMLIAGTARLVR